MSCACHSIRPLRRQFQILLSTTVIAKTATDAALLATVPRRYTGAGLARVTGPGVSSALISSRLNKRTTNLPPVPLIEVVCKSALVAPGRYEVMATACTLDGAVSSDPDGFVTTYTWALIPTLESNCPVYRGSRGWIDRGADGTLLLLFPADQLGWDSICVVGLTVGDNDGLRGRTRANVTLILTGRGENEPPSIEAEDLVVEIDQEDGSYDNTTTVDVAAIAADPDGLLARSWLDYVGGDGSALVSVVANVSAGGGPVQRASIVSQATVYGLGTWRFTAYAVDGSDASASRNISLTVRMGPPPPMTDSVSPDAARRVAIALSAVCAALALYGAALRLVGLKFGCPDADCELALMSSHPSVGSVRAALPQSAAAGAFFAIFHLQTLASFGFLTNSVLPQSFKAFCEALSPFLLLAPGISGDPLPRNVRASPKAYPPPLPSRRALLYSPERDVAAGLKSVLVITGSALGLLSVVRLAAQCALCCIRLRDRERGGPAWPGPLASLLAWPALELLLLLACVKPLTMTAVGVIKAGVGAPWSGVAWACVIAAAAFAALIAPLLASYVVHSRRYIVFERNICTRLVWDKLQRPKFVQSRKERELARQKRREARSSSKGAVHKCIGPAPPGSGSGADSGSGVVPGKGADPPHLAMAAQTRSVVGSSQSGSVHLPSMSASAAAAAANANFERKWWRPDHVHVHEIRQHRADPDIDVDSVSVTAFSSSDLNVNEPAADRAKPAPRSSAVLGSDVAPVPAAATLYSVGDAPAWHYRLLRRLRGALSCGWWVVPVEPRTPSKGDDGADHPDVKGGYNDAADPGPYRFAIGLHSLLGDFRKTHAMFRGFEVAKAIAWGAAIGAFARNDGTALADPAQYNVTSKAAFTQLYFCLGVEGFDLIAQNIYRPRVSAWACGVAALSPLVHMAMLAALSSAALKYNWCAAHITKLNIIGDSFTSSKL
eukprot:tig00020902_g14977.t1